VSVAAAPQFLLARRLDGTDLPSQPTDRFYPLVNADGSVRLGREEIVLWRGQVGVSEQFFTPEFDDFDRMWDLPEPADMVVTSERVAFVCRRWAVGGGWTSHGSAPMTAMALNAASKMRAAAKRHGVVMVGHCRWEWPTHVQVWPGSMPTGRKSRPRLPGIRLSSCVALVKGYSALTVSGHDLATAAAADTAANTILQAVISHRLRRQEALRIDAQVIEALSTMAAGPSFNCAESGVAQGRRLGGILMVGFLNPAEYADDNAQRILDKEEG